MRFDCGSVGRFAPPDDRRLTEIDSTSLVHFRVKLVDDEHRVVAVADDIIVSEQKPEVTGRMPLLPVSFTGALGQQAWRVASARTPARYSAASNLVTNFHGLISTARGPHRSDRPPLLGPEAPPPQTRRHHPHPPRQPPPPDRRHPATRLQLRPLRHARPRDPATAPAGIRRVAAAAAAYAGGGEGECGFACELTVSQTERWRLAGWLGGVSPPTAARLQTLARNPAARRQRFGHEPLTFATGTGAGHRRPELIRPTAARYEATFAMFPHPHPGNERGSRRWPSRDGR
jgi:hypothetical protein